MQTLEILNRKIKTAHDLLGVVKTMKTLAAVNIRQFERAVESLENYRNVVDMGWTVLMRLSQPLPSKTANPKTVCMGIASDQGMCGQYNESLWSYVQKKVEALEAQGLKTIFWSAGEKIRQAVQDTGRSGGEHFPSPGTVASIHARVQEVIGQIDRWRTSRRLDQMYLCHHVVARQGGYFPVFDKVLPLDPEWIKARISRKWPCRCLPMVGVSPDVMFSRLFHHYLFVTFFRAFAQSLAAENAARLMAMQSAEKNIIEREEELQALFREQRQTGITSELLDIISGFESLKEGEVGI